jgi:hypothetical protein
MLSPAENRMDVVVCKPMAFSFASSADFPATKQAKKVISKIFEIAKCSLLA